MVFLRRGLLYPIAAALPLLICAILMAHVLFQWHVKPRLDDYRKLQGRHFEAFRSDLSYLLKANLVTEKERQQHDAGPFLNPRVYWSPQSEGFLVAPKVPRQTKETLFRFRDEWIRKFERAQHMPADLSIFPELLRFDHWDIEQNSPISKLVEAGRFVPPPEMPIPDASDLLALVKLRLMNGAFDKKFKSALLETRKLAHLMLSTENMQLMLAGIAILDYERQAYRFYVDHRDMPAKSWSPVDRNITRRAHRAILATRAYLYLWTAPSQLDAIFLGDHASIGLCAAANEALPREFALRPLLKPSWPAELNLRAEYEKLEQIYEKARGECRLRYLSKLVDNDAIRVRIPGPIGLTDLPYIRKVFGLRSGVASFQGLEPYESTSY